MDKALRVLGLVVLFGCLILVLVAGVKSCWADSVVGSNGPAMGPLANQPILDGLAGFLCLVVFIALIVGGFLSLFIKKK